MHPFVMFAVLHATGLAVLAFFIWFAAAHTSGLLRLFGVILGAWIALLAIACIVMPVMWPGHGMGPMHGWMNREGPPAAASNAAP